MTSISNMEYICGIHEVKVIKNTDYGYISSMLKRKEKLIGKKDGRTECQWGQVELEMRWQRCVT